MTKKKIAIVGLGNAGIVTAMHFYHYGKNVTDLVDSVDIYYDPSVPIERVGQGSVLAIAKLINKIIDTNWFDNKINATVKTGILYENWGKKVDKFIHMFPLNEIAIHYQPHLLSEAILESGKFNIIEKSVDNMNDVDADYVFDCRGKHINDWNNYDTLINPLNSALIYRKSTPDYRLQYTRCVATPDGWCFVIPNVDSVSYGYLYNDVVSSKDDATKNFKDIFECDVDFSLSFKNYVSKNMFQGDRVILNGNRYCFLEPLEATSTGLYQMVAQHAWQNIFLGAAQHDTNAHMRKLVKQIETFVLWHYQYGSAYDTPFWNYAKSLPFHTDKEFDILLQKSRQHSLKELLWDHIDKEEYAQWNPFSFKVWEDNV
jgi:tryptophan halogenase